ncbi:hypothetical protein TanjilG_21374 [Lupinus angustifolius]|uniref:Metaxin n=1 Tax=Lupinus angustifolius TaxID=3871 RepID=A0A4P1RNQ1_LUPAN|nr:PREDICTED: mitochondrial outer membrane import complex protein METAXIN-like isoform X1 [Lupinus angustifolius]OIW14234.1 hypothetical protein TanjilG_21374 [Lupinus angustifolius]
MSMEAANDNIKNTLVVRKPCFGLPTACPQSLSAYIYLKLSQLPFHLHFHLNYPDSDQIPYFEAGDSVVYNNEKEGIIECLKKDARVGDLDLDSGVSSLPEWIPTKVMLTTWLADALEYELWVGCDGSSAYNIYYSDLPWPIGKVLFWKKYHWVKQKHAITKNNVEVKEEEIYERANSAYDALSTLLGDANYLLGSRPSSLDAIFLAHALVVLQALPESSTLQIKFSEHVNLVRYVQQRKTELIEAGAFPSNDTPFHAGASSSASRGSKSKSKPKGDKTKEESKEEKTYRKRAKYFVVAQVVAVVLFVSIMSGYGNGDVEVDDADADYGYD